MQKNTVPANHPVKNARFQERCCQAQNRPAAASGASHACPALGKASASATALNAETMTEVTVLRKILFVVSVAAFTFAGCGRQVTPTRGSVTPSGLPSGFMQVKFTTAAPMDFTNVQYVIMFNTSTSGGMPYANGYQTNYANYWFAIVVGGNGVLSQATVVQYVRQSGLGGGTVAVPQPIPYPQ